MNDQRTVRLVIFLLGTIALVCVAGGIYLTAIGESLPDSLVALAGLAAGALAGLLSQTNASPPGVPVEP